MCPLCGSSQTVVLFTKKNTEYSACGSCQFRFASPDVNPNFANTLGDYEASYLQYLAPDAADEANEESLRSWMNRFYRLDGARLLDVGAGSGKLVRRLRLHGVLAEGLEPSRALFEHFLVGDDAFTCAMLADHSAKKYDVVTAFDVIEHVAHPQEFLADVAAALKPGGVFLASTPNVGSMTANLFGKHWHFYYPYHLSYFSPRTLSTAAAKHGFELVDWCHRGRLRSVGYVIRYAAEFIRGGKAPAWAQRFDSWYVPINLFDTMYLAFRKSDG
ncbi:MAG: Methyltransferase type 12 [Acidobacteria bacterium]|nr:Methyltransferase type 12 [Acidobacteriota bacterium]